MRVQALQPGDIVDVIAPASRCSSAELRRAVAAVRAVGLVPRVPKDLFATSGSRLFANTDERRLEMLRAALYARDSKLVWCVRGGYGSLRLLPDLQRWRRPSHAKILLGYSDITTLHSFVNQQWGWPSLHGPLLDRFGRATTPSKEKRELLDILFGRCSTVEFNELKALNAAARRPGLHLRAPIVGGNMAVLQSSLGTKAALKTAGRILFFEDTGERPHRVDRMLTQMRQARWFRRARAVVFGHFLLNDASDRRELWGDVIPRFARECAFPVVCGLPSGHSPRQQRTLPLGTRAELELKSSSSLRLSVDSGIA